MFTLGGIPSNTAMAAVARTLLLLSASTIWSLPSALTRTKRVDAVSGGIVIFVTPVEVNPGPSAGTVRNGSKRTSPSSIVAFVDRKNRTTDPLASCPPWFLIVVVIGIVDPAAADTGPVATVGMRSGPTITAVADAWTLLVRAGWSASWILFKAFARAMMKYFPARVSARIRTRLTT